MFVRFIGDGGRLPPGKYFMDMSIRCSIMRCLAALAAVVVCCAVSGQEWRTDVLGAPFEMRYVRQASDYSGPVCSTVIRLRAESPAPGYGRTGVLYVHGFNDYFFQKEMAERFVEHGYGFYAVDLRKYGRSLKPGQRRFEVRNLREYFPDIDSALRQMHTDGIRRVVLMGHSTGGLISALYMSQRPDPAIRTLVLNSPFLDWNQSRTEERVLIPAVRSVSGLVPKLRIPQGGGDEYARSLLRRYGGEWDYDTTWKLVHSPAVDAAWIAAIDEAQDIVQNDPGIMVPVLVMRSDHTLNKSDGGDTFRHCDVVLDVADIARYGARLGPAVTVVSVRGGLHDLALSEAEVRDAMFDYLFSYLWGVCPPVTLPEDSAE